MTFAKALFSPALNRRIYSALSAAIGNFETHTRVCLKGIF